MTEIKSWTDIPSNWYISSQRMMHIWENYFNFIKEQEKKNKFFGSGNCDYFHEKLMQIIEEESMEYEKPIELK